MEADYGWDLDVNAEAVTSMSSALASLEEETTGQPAPSIAIQFPCAVQLGGLNKRRSHAPMPRGGDEWDRQKGDGPAQQAGGRGWDSHGSDVGDYGWDLDHPEHHHQRRAQTSALDFITVETLSKRRTKTAAGPSRKRPKKRTNVRTYGNGLRAFYRTVLFWPAEKKALASRAALGLPPLCAAAGSFQTADAFYASVEELAVEEAREAVAQALQTGAKCQMGARLSLILKADVQPAPKTLSSLYFTFKSRPGGDSAREAIRAGSILALTPGPTPGLHYSKRAGCLFRTESQPGEATLLAAVMGGGGDGELELLAIQAPEWSQGPQGCKVLRAKAPWTALPLTSVIVQQRQSAVAFMRPDLPVLYRLMGGTPARHTKFDDSSSDSEGSEGGDPNREGTDSKAGQGCGDSSDGVDSEEDGDGELEECVGVRPRRQPVRLNSAQQAALRKCTGAGDGSLELVQGPPGCGKTAFTAALVGEFLQQGKRVLVAAPSNKGVAVALAACTAANPQLRDRFVLVGVEQALAVAGQGHEDNDDEEVEESWFLAQDLVADAYVYSKAQRLLQRLDRCGEYLEAFTAEGHSMRRSASSFGFCSAEDFDRVVRVSHTESCQHSTRQAAHTAAAARRALHFLVDSLSDMCKGRQWRRSSECSAALGCLLGLCEETKAQWPCSRSSGLLKALAESGALLRTVSEELGEWLGAEAGRRDAVAEAMLKISPCVFATLGSAGGALVRAMSEVDVLVVDESAQALEGDIVLGLVSQPRQMVLVGDPAQLPATLLSKEAAGLARGRSAMARLMDSGAPFSLLDTQYRMVPSISAFPCLRFYNGRLKDDSSTLSRFSPVIGPFRRPYSFIDVAGTEVAQPSIANPVEAHVASRFVAYLLRDGNLAPGSRVQVICFYSAQVLAVRRELRASGSGWNACPVATVDSFQGSEADVCIVSLGRCNARGNVGFVSDPQRLNVALTRARHMLIVLGSAATMRKSKSLDLQGLVRDAEARECLLQPSSEELSPVLAVDNNKRDYCQLYSDL